MSSVYICGSRYPPGSFSYKSFSFGHPRRPSHSPSIPVLPPTHPSSPCPLLPRTEGENQLVEREVIDHPPPVGKSMIGKHVLPFPHTRLVGPSRSRPVNAIHHGHYTDVPMRRCQASRNQSWSSRKSLRNSIQPSREPDLHPTAQPTSAESFPSSVSEMQPSILVPHCWRSLRTNRRECCGGVQARQKQRRPNVLKMQNTLGFLNPQVVKHG